MVGLQWQFYCKHCAECTSKRILETYQNLAKIRPQVWHHVVFTHIVVKTIKKYTTDQQGYEPARRAAAVCSSLPFVQSTTVQEPTN